MGGRGLGDGGTGGRGEWESSPPFLASRNALPVCPIRPVPPSPSLPVCPISPHQSLSLPSLFRRVLTGSGARGVIFFLDSNTEFAEGPIAFFVGGVKTEDVLSS